AGLGQKATAAIAVTDRFAIDQSGLQGAPADRTVHPGGLAENARAIAGVLGNMAVAAVHAVEVTVIACQLHRRAAAGTVHVWPPRESTCSPGKHKTRIPGGQNASLDKRLERRAPPKRGGPRPRHSSNFPLGP